MSIFHWVKQETPRHRENKLYKLQKMLLLEAFLSYRLETTSLSKTKCQVSHCQRISSSIWSPLLSPSIIIWLWALFNINVRILKHLQPWKKRKHSFAIAETSVAPCCALRRRSFVAALSANKIFISTVDCYWLLLVENLPAPFYLSPAWCLSWLCDIFLKLIYWSSAQKLEHYDRKPDLCAYIPCGPFSFVSVVALHCVSIRLWVWFSKRLLFLVETTKSTEFFNLLIC